MIVCLQRKNKYSSIADLTSSRLFYDQSHDIVDFVIVGDNVDDQFRQERFVVFGTAINYWPSLLTAVSSNF